jgi:benzylsuccinate CoA-transferase BbsE subunit
MTALGQFRVLELASEGGATFCGRLLADLGAEVIKIEPPGGCPTRGRAPFWKDAGPLPLSLAFFSNNLGKKGITLDLTASDGAELFRRLVRVADAVVESMAPGRLEALGLDYPQLREVNAGIVWTSITPFGRSGPKARWQANDLVAFAAGGLMYISGKPEGPPVVGPDEQAYRVGGSHGAFGTLVAFWARRQSGAGQLVEVSLQECLAAQENLVTDFARKGEVIPRTGSQHRRGVPGRIYPCKDGFVHLMVVHTQAGAWERFLDWIGRPADLSDPRFADPLFRYTHRDRVDRMTREFCLRHTKRELYQAAQARHIPCTPVSTPADFVEDEQVRWRGYVTEVVVRGRRLPTLGSPVRSSEEEWMAIGSAPELGEHNDEVYSGLLGLSAGEIDALRQAQII